MHRQLFPDPDRPLCHLDSNWARPRSLQLAKVALPQTRNVLQAPDRGHAGVWPFDGREGESYPDFIIGEDENGRPFRHSIDNDSPEHVMVFLGDLGRDLPESERDHWRSQNVAPSSRMSGTSFRRSFLNQPTSPQAPDLNFKHRYQTPRNKWCKTFGWALFRDPVTADEHVLKRLRIPLSESQPEFEAQVLKIAYYWSMR